VRIGDARRALLDEAMVWNPHAIFLGGRRLQRLRRFLFGSVAGSVADDAPCTVEVVRPR
jgi:nucleotide-binding universal stress UspA family protein